MKALAQARDLLGSLTGEFFPDGPESVWAQAIEAGWAVDQPGDYCRRCGVSAGAGATTEQGCSFCRGERLAWDRVVRLGSYDEPLREWFRREWAWCGVMAKALAASIGPDAAGSPAASRTVVCPVPMHWTRRWRRGYNQARLMAATLAGERKWEMIELLDRVKRTPPQTSVPFSERPANIRQSFAAKNIDLTGWEVWLVDDIMTSGATLHTCARLLRGAGAARVNVAVAAVADPAELRESKS